MSMQSAQRHQRQHGHTQHQSRLDGNGTGEMPGVIECEIPGTQTRDRNRGRHASNRNAGGRKRPQCDTGFPRAGGLSHHLTKEEEEGQQ